jgi:hypothetical protein
MSKDFIFKTLFPTFFMQATLSYYAYEALLKTMFVLGNLLFTVLKRAIWNFTKFMKVV